MELPENLEKIRLKGTHAPDPAEFRRMTPQELAMALARARPGGTHWHLLTAEQRRRERWPSLLVSVLALIVALSALIANLRDTAY